MSRSGQGFVQFGAALGLGWLIWDLVRCTYGTLADVIQIPGDAGWPGVADCRWGRILLHCALGSGGDRSSLILPSSLHWRLPHSECVSNWAEIE